MNSHVCWIGVAVLVGVGLIVPIQAGCFRHQVLVKRA